MLGTCHPPHLEIDVRTGWHRRTHTRRSIQPSVKYVSIILIVALKCIQSCSIHNTYLRIYTIPLPYTVDLILLHWRNLGCMFGSVALLHNFDIEPSLQLETRANQHAKTCLKVLSARLINSIKKSCHQPVSRPTEPISSRNLGASPRLIGRRSFPEMGR